MLYTLNFEHLIVDVFLVPNLYLPTILNIVLLTCSSCIIKRYLIFKTYFKQWLQQVNEMKARNLKLKLTLWFYFSPFVSLATTFIRESIIAYFDHIDPVSDFESKYLFAFPLYKSRWCRYIHLKSKDKCLARNT